MNSRSFVLKGDVCFSETKDRLATHRASYVVCEDGVCRGVFAVLPEKYKNLPLTDCGNCLILPGMCDLHVHAPQFAYRGLGMDLELLDWLYKYAFPEETKYRDTDYARRAYGVFSDHMKHSATTRAVIFATVHREATEILMEQLDAVGLPCFVGKLNMDRDCPDDLRERDAAFSAAETERWILESRAKFTTVKPMITPRFLPSCTDGCLEKIGRLAAKYNVPVQSHLSENPSEIEYVQSLFPDTKFYAEGYDKYGLFGQTPTVMAHCVYSTDAEIALMKQNNVFIAHCPASNINVCSGIAPMRKYIDAGLRVGLATDVAGGETESMFRAVMHAIQSSNMYWRLVDQTKKPLSFDEGFWLGTAAGGAFFGKVGTFLDGYEFDAVVLDDSECCDGRVDFTLHQRLERAVYLGADSRGIRAKYAKGNKIL